MTKIKSFYGLPEGRRVAIKQAVIKMHDAAYAVDGNLDTCSFTIKGEEFLIPNCDTVIRHSTCDKIYAIDMGPWGEVNNLGFTYDAKILGLLRTKLKSGNMHGEHGFPLDRTIERLHTVDVSGVSHEVMDGAHVDGRFILYVRLIGDTLDKVKGKDMKFGMRALTSVRAGTLTPTSATVTHLITWDFIGHL